MHPMLTITIRAARQAGNIIANSYEKTDMRINTVHHDFMTHLANKLKQIIIEIIHKYYPTHTIITAEMVEIRGETNHIKWFINPLDGTTNFLKRLPHFAVSIAVSINGQTEIAGIYNPMLNELFTAVRGQGAQLNGYRLRFKNTNGLDRAIIATCFPVQDKKYSAAYMNIVAKLFQTCSDFRCTGSATLDLAYVATGRVDAFFAMNLKPCHFLAGELLVREAGGMITNLVGGYNYRSSGHLLAGRPRIMKKLCSEISTYLTDKLKI